MNRIGDYALLSDCSSAALVGRDGSIDWACFPRFDSPSVFAKLLDVRRGGSFRVRPARVRATYRAYLEDTNVLLTTFDCAGGVLELTDCMPVRAPADGADSHVASRDAILRRLRCTAGLVDVAVTIAPRFEYAALVPRFRLTSRCTGEIVGGAHALWVTGTQQLQRLPQALTGNWELRQGEEAWVEVAWTPSYAVRALDEAPSVAQLQERLDDTIAFWRGWMADCWYDGEHELAVRRSALVLKGLTYAQTGAVVAAPTTSLPEEVGGVRNWDYRYTWIRDATLTLNSLFILGFSSEADAFRRWLERTAAGRPADLQLMYGIQGERLLPEFELDHLAGHRGSRPVRVGNGAATQTQLDMYGEILHAAYLVRRADGELSGDYWRFLAEIAELVCHRWREPDHGIWEVRDKPRHFTHSKLNCWVALDRAVRLATEHGLPGPVARWKREREAIRHYLLTEAAPDGWLRQAADVDAPDAATLLAPAYGLLPTDHAVVRRTLAVIRRELEHDGLVERYRVPDGLRGGEGAFLICSFWLIDCLTHSGRLEEAEELLYRLLDLGNDVGLYPEQVALRSGRALGNFPQAFTHMALVTSCAHLSAAKRGEVPATGAHDYTELALERLIAARRRVAARAAMA